MKGLAIGGVVAGLGLWKESAWAQSAAAPRATGVLSGTDFDVNLGETLVALGVPCVVLTSHAVIAHEGHAHRIMGTVTMAAADHVMLKDRDGKDVTVKVTQGTKVKSTPALKVEAIKAGTRVVISATQGKDKSCTAKTIEVGAATAAPK